MSAHSSKHAIREMPADTKSATTVKPVTAAASKKCSKFGPLLMRLRQLVQGQREEMDKCTRAVMEVAGDAQVVRDELTASLVLSR